MIPFVGAKLAVWKTPTFVTVFVLSVAFCSMAGAVMDAVYGVPAWYGMAAGVVMGMVLVWLARRY